MAIGEDTSPLQNIGWLLNSTCMDYDTKSLNWQVAAAYYIQDTTCGEQSLVHQKLRQYYNLKCILASIPVEIPGTACLTTKQEACCPPPQPWRKHAQH